MHNSCQNKEALLYKTLENNEVKCDLCSFHCKISPNKTGRCAVRKNIDGVLYSLNYDKICSLAVDPIEKKPLFHFLPGSKSLSLAAFGCNFKCEFCQNSQISQFAQSGKFPCAESYSPERIVQLALENDCQSISYTYSEPTVFFELAQETAKIAREKGLKNVFVSNGYFSHQALEKMENWLDAINIDLKSFSEKFYQKTCKASLKPVLRNIEQIAKHTEIWLEITTLVIPELNDSDTELRSIAEFIADKASPQIPWHVSAFHPAYKMPQTSSTPQEKLLRAFEIGTQASLKHIYLGNIHRGAGENTVCQNCGETLLERHYFQVGHNFIKQGQCPKCREKIAGVWR